MLDFLELVVIYIMRMILTVFHLFPIRKERIVFYSFNGKQYSCNPRRITEYLLESHEDLQIIWAFKEPEKFGTTVPSGIKCVKYRSILYYYYVKTARFVIFNVQGYGEVKRRRGQDIIQTWHASNGYKKLGAYSSKIKRKKYLLGHKDYSYVMCGSKNMEEHRVRGSMGYKGEIIKGTPRMDSIINRDLDLKTKVYAMLGIKSSQRIVLYAPTWRSNRNENDYGLDYSRVKESFEKRFGGDWIIVVRLHPNVYIRPSVKQTYVVDATAYPDMEELIYVADAMISDYSSCIWDFSFTYHPCFLFCADLTEYEEDRNFDIPIRAWGFPLSVTTTELCNSIINFDEARFTESMNEHHQQMGSYEDGHATERVCRLIHRRG